MSGRLTDDFLFSEFAGNSPNFTRIAVDLYEKYCVWGGDPTPLSLPVNTGRYRLLNVLLTHSIESSVAAISFHKNRKKTLYDP